MPQYKPGDRVPSRCTRCNDVTGHVIVALVNDQIVKVECRACGSVHRYRAPEGAKPAREEKAQRVKQGTDRTDAVRAARAASSVAFERASVPAAEKRTAAKAAAAAQVLADEWKRALGRAPEGDGRAYSMQERFELGEVLEHPVFGSGVVKEVLPPDKIRVLFRDGPRLLRCAG